MSTLAQDPLPHSIPATMLAVRAAVAARHLGGPGVEIGGLHYPLTLPPGASAVHVDVSPTSVLERRYADIAQHHAFTPTAIVADAMALPFPAESRNWVAACHVLEHLYDPVGAVANHLQIVRPGGVLYYALPDMRRCFDRDRDRTTIEHLLEDQSKPRVYEHYLEWTTRVMKLEGDAAVQQAQLMTVQRANIHFHAWDDTALFKFLTALSEHWLLPCWIEEYRRNDTEFLVVLRKMC